MVKDVSVHVKTSKIPPTDLRKYSRVISILRTSTSIVGPTYLSGGNGFGGCTAAIFGGETEW